jgi:hypothetical protein
VNGIAYVPDRQVSLRVQARAIVMAVSRSPRGWADASPVVRWAVGASGPDRTAKLVIERGRSAPPPLDGDFSTGIETKPARCRHARLSDARATSD